MIVFLRHAESAWNAVFSRTRVDPGLPDPPLTEEGRRQAEAVAGRLAETGVARLFASPYRRTLETASIIAGRLGLPIEVEPLVRERFAFSCDIGTPASELRRNWPELDLDGLPEIWWGGLIESDRSVAARCRAFRRKLRQSDGERPIAVVSHWGFLLAFTGRRFDNGSLLVVARHSVLEEGDEPA